MTGCDARPARRDPVAEIAGGSGLRHVALLYRDQDEYLAAADGFVTGALDRQEPVFIAVPGEKLGAVCATLSASAGPAAFIEGVAFGDMAQLGRNPARIIPAMRAFIDHHPGRRVHCFAEPVWPARTDSELREAARHEALINLAFARQNATIICPYDVGALPAATLTDAERTHPVLVRAGESRPSPGFLGPAGLPSSCEQPLAHPPSWAQRRHYRTDLRPVRDLVARYGALTGLPVGRLPDLVLAVSEIAANTLRHTTSGGLVQIWHTGQEVVCQIDDNGQISDPLAGRVRPAGDELGGHGLWLVNQVCDLVEVRTSPIGTTVRLRMSLSA